MDNLHHRCSHSMVSHQWDNQWVMLVNLQCNSNQWVTEAHLQCNSNQWVTVLHHQCSNKQPQLPLWSNKLHLLHKPLSLLSETLQMLVLSKEQDPLLPISTAVSATPLEQPTTMKVWVNHRLWLWLFFLSSFAHFSSFQLCVVMKWKREFTDVVSAKTFSSIIQDERFWFNFNKINLPYSNILIIDNYL